MDHTSLDPITMQPVERVKKLLAREVQRALMQHFEPENWFVVRRALVDAGRKDSGQLAARHALAPCPQMPSAPLTGARLRTPHRPTSPTPRQAGPP